jgi:hypothetical protein
MENPLASHGGFAHKAWLIFSAATILGSLTILAIYVKVYDDYGLTDRLPALGRFTRQAMGVASFPLGLLLGAIADNPLKQIFDCGASNDPCDVFIAWWTHFTAVIALVFLLRGLVRRAR